MTTDRNTSVEQTKARHLAAIMFTDIVGFSRQMGADEARTLRLLAVRNQIVQQVVSVHHGHIIKTVGDAFLVDFPSIVHAVQCAQQIQQQLRGHNLGIGCERELGREEGARAADAEILRLMPQFSVERWKRMAPYQDPAVTECFAAALCKAGLK